MILKAIRGVSKQKTLHAILLFKRHEYNYIEI